MTKELKKQTIANKKWEEKNKEYSSYLKSRSSAKSFIKKWLTPRSLREFNFKYSKRHRTSMSSMLYFFTTPFLFINY